MYYSAIRSNVFAYLASKVRLPVTVTVVMHIALVALVSGALAQDDPEGAAATGSISGTVTAEADGSPVQGISVCAFFDSGSGWQSVGCDYSAADGTFNIGGLSTDSYRVKFDTSNNFYLVTEYYDDAPTLDSADDVPVSDGIATTGIDATLTAYANITGTVTAETGGAPLMGITARAYLYRDGSWQSHKYNGFSDASGHYDIPGLITGVYRIEFYDNSGVYWTKFYGDTLDLDSARDVAVTAGNIHLGVDVALAGPAHITGTVTDSGDGSLLQSISADIYRFNGSAWLMVDSATTNNAGVYHVGDLAAGTYRIGFFDWNLGAYIGEYYDDAADLGSATDIVVAADSTITGIDAALAPVLPGQISGTVTAESGGAPLAGIEVCSYSEDLMYGWVIFGCDQTDAGGDYTISNLRVGIHRVHFSDNIGSYVGEYFDNEPDLNSSTNIDVTSGSSITGIDAALALPPPPDNDDFDAATLVDTFPYQDVIEIAGATTAADDPDFPCGPAGKGSGSVWYTVTPEQGSLLSADAFVDSYDTYLAVWEGERGSLMPVACSGSAGSHGHPYVTNVRLIGGMTYYIEVAGTGSYMGILTIDIELTPESPFVDCVSDTDDDASIGVPAGVTINGNGGRELAPGDEFALYTPDGATCAGHAVWMSPGLAITAWGVDSIEPERGGFGVGDEMIFRMWDQSTGKKYDDIVATYSQGTGVYAIDSIHVVSDLDITVTQDILLLGGWNFISSYVEPNDPAIEAVLAPIASDMVLAKNCDGKVYWPALPFNNIVNWDVRDAYKIIMNNPRILPITGRQVDPTQTPIDLPAGWSCVAYLRDTPMPIVEALNSTSDELVVAKNGYGEIYWPYYDVNQIGEMQPGEGYQLYMNAPATLTYPPN